MCILPAGRPIRRHLRSATTHDRLPGSTASSLAHLPGSTASGLVRLPGSTASGLARLPGSTASGFAEAEAHGRTGVASPGSLSVRACAKALRPCRLGRRT